MFINLNIQPFQPLIVQDKDVQAFLYVGGGGKN